MIDEDTDFEAEWEAFKRHVGNRYFGIGSSAGTRPNVMIIAKDVNITMLKEVFQIWDDHGLVEWCPNGRMRINPKQLE